MNSSRYYKRSLSTRNGDTAQITFSGKQTQQNYLSPMAKKTRINLSRIDGFENLIPPFSTPKQVKNLLYLSKYPKPINTQDEAPFNSVIQGYFLPTPRKVSFQMNNKIITEPTQFNMSPIRKRQADKQVLNKNFIEDEIDIDKQLNIPQKIRLYFSCQKLQKRLLKLQELFQFISIKTICGFLNEQNAGTIDYISEFDISYKQFLLTEYLLIVLYFLMKYNLIKKNELNKLEKLITYQHQQNVCNVVYNLQINVHGYMNYMHLFYQQQQANPQIPKKIDQLNLFVDKIIDDSIKNLINYQLQQRLREYLFMKIEQKTSEFIEKLKKILDFATNCLYFLPKNDNDYTLILDLEETIIHKKNDEIKLRPFLKDFLEEISRYYEIVVFGHQTQQEIDQIIDQIDENKLIKYKLNKNHLMKYEKVFIKDLSLLGRPGNKVIVIDNDPFNFILSPQNGIQIRSWCGDSDDYALYDLISFLGDLRLYKDVRIGLKQVKTYSQYFYVPQ